jgi:hypothetical protein
MLHFPCASLGDLAGQLSEKYEVRNKVIARSFQDPDLLSAENEIIRINKLISSHRRRCPNCKRQEGRATLSSKNLRRIPTELLRPMDLAS